jgi:hypothetical protein
VSHGGDRKSKFRICNLEPLKTVRRRTVLKAWQYLARRWKMANPVIDPKDERAIAMTCDPFVEGISARGGS